jgi:hypothetical protein
MNFEWRITAGLVYVVALRTDIAVLSARLTPIENSVIKITDVLITLARQDAQIHSLQEQITELTNGRNGK